MSIASEKGPPHEREQASDRPPAQAHGERLLLCGDRSLLLITPSSSDRSADRSAGFPANERVSRAYVIEVYDGTNGIVTGDGCGFGFFCSERAFDSLEGRHFRSARDLELAARALDNAGRHLARRSAEPKKPSIWSAMLDL